MNRPSEAITEGTASGRRSSFSQPVHDTHRHGESIASYGAGRTRDRHHHGQLDSRGPLNATGADGIVRHNKARSAELHSPALPHSNHRPDQHQRGDLHGGSNRSKIGRSITVGSGITSSGLQVQHQGAEGGYRLQASDDGTSHVQVGGFV